MRIMGVGDFEGREIVDSGSEISLASFVLKQTKLV
ncbi:hypothetical protein BCO_0900150 (plasmid) [Borrelia coriaceae ATCC 43381]|uniref:Uncharacterized protein n=1 Tax=Borrelia coriaceae ATCC 43381 TaxID=1408429 RepID=W5SYD6_9SPIR|nr:hypothetical protein BCO_0900150 [Borrelia coriaceae ATCC 43381]